MSINQIPLVKVRDNLFVAELDDSNLLNGIAFYLAVNSPMQAAELARIVPNMHLGIKICSREVIHAVVGSALPAIHLTETDSFFHTDAEFSGDIYFKLDNIGPYWDGIVNSKSMGVYVPDQIADAQIKLFVDDLSICDFVSGD